MTSLLRGMLVLLAFLLAGEALGRLLSLPLPGSVLGMVLLAAALHLGLVKKDAVKPAADVLLANLPFFFVPAGVAVALYADVLRAQWLPIVVASVVSTLAVFATVGWLQQRLERRR